MTADIGAVQHICQKLYQTGLYRFGVVIQPGKGKVSRSAKNSALGSLFWYVKKICFYCISIMLF